MGWGGATVEVLRLGEVTHRAVTDEAGTAVIRGVGMGPFQVRVEAFGFHSRVE